MENEGKGEGALVLFPGALGDAVCTEPAIAWLASRGPVRFLARGSAAEVARLFPSRPHVGSLDGREVARLFAPPGGGEDGSVGWLASYERVFSFTGASSPELRARFERAGNALVFPFPRRSGAEHAADEMLAAVSGGAAATGAIPALRLADTAPVPSPGRLALHPGSGGVAKRAPRELFREVAARWRKAGGSIDVVLGPAEADERSWWDSEVGPVVAPADVLELGRALARAAVYLGNDSGPSHVAAALGLPAAVLFVETRPERFGPRGARVRAVGLAEDGAGAVWRALEPALP